MKFPPDCPYRLSEDILYKKDVQELFDILRRAAHGYYAFLAQEPLRHFCITVDDDYSDLYDRVGVEDFFDRYALYHPRLAVCSIQYRIYRFRKDWDEQVPGWRDYLPTYDGVELGACWDRAGRRDLYYDLPRILAHSLREAMRNNRPFELTPETIETYGFTAEDVTALEPIIAACNTELKAEFRSDYERLVALDCIREER